MDENEVITIDDENVEIIVDGEKYYKIDDCYSKPYGFIIPVINKIKDSTNQIEKLLYSCPTFVEVIKSAVPNDIYQAVLTSEQKKGLMKGTIELMTSKKGNLIANLIDPKTKKIISKVNLEKIKLSSELNKALANYNAQAQIAQIAEEIQYVKIAVEEVRKGQENDRLAIAYSCKQKLLQAMAIEDPKIRQLTLINLVASAEDSRNKLMLSQTETVEFLKKQPKKFWGKFKNTKEDEQKDKKISELRESMNALNMVSLAETLAYQEMGEQKAANIALKYYGNYMNDVYLSDKTFIERLDSLNPSPKKYWSTILPDICKNIKSLNISQEKILMEEYTNEKES